MPMPASLAASTGEPPSANTKLQPATASPQLHALRKGRLKGLCCPYEASKPQLIPLVRQTESRASHKRRLGRKALKQRQWKMRCATSSDFRRSVVQFRCRVQGTFGPSGTLQGYKRSANLPGTDRFWPHTAFRLHILFRVHEFQLTATSMAPLAEA